MPGRSDKAGHKSIALGEYDTESEGENGDYEDDDLEDLERQRGGSPAKDDDGNKTSAGGGDNEKEGEQPEPKPKRVLAPRAKLDPDRLCGASGLPALLKNFETIKWHPKGYENENLQMMMRKMEEWAHAMYPKTRFDDTLEKIQHLGSKRQVKTCVQKLILGLPVLPEDFVSDQVGETASEPAKNAESDYDNLFNDDVSIILPSDDVVAPTLVQDPFPAPSLASRRRPIESATDMDEDIPEEYLVDKPADPGTSTKAGDEDMDMIDFDDMDAFLQSD